MQQKYIAIGLAVVVAIAAIGGGIAMLAKSNSDNDNNHELPDISGKWNLAYIEFAKLSDDNEKPIYDPKQVTITDHHLNPYEPEAYIEVTQVGEHGFIGAFNGEHENEVAGTRDGSIIKFALEREGHLHLCELSAKEGYLSGAMTVINHAQGSAPAVVCGVAYILLIPDGEKPVPIRSDYFDMSVMKVAKPIKSVLHHASDFEGEKTGRGTDVKTTVKYVKTHNMISIISTEKEGVANPTSIQAVASMGVTPRGTVGGVLAGNMISPIDNTRNWAITGNMMMAHGKAMFLNYHSPELNDTPSYVEIECNVPYNKGGNLTPVYISEELQYKGTLTLKTLDGEPNEKEITRNFKVFDNTIYSQVTEGDDKYTWFGEIYGHALVINVMKGQSEVGRFSGHVNLDGEIHLFGVMIDSTTMKPSVFIDISLELVL